MNPKPTIYRPAEGERSRRVLAEIVSSRAMKLFRGGPQFEVTFAPHSDRYPDVVRFLIPARPAKLYANLPLSLRSWIPPGLPEAMPPYSSDRLCWITAHLVESDDRRNPTIRYLVAPVKF